MATLNLQVTAGADDARNYGPTYPGTLNFSSSATTDRIGAIYTPTPPVSNYYMVGARFQNVTIPRGSVINSADIQVCADSNLTTPTAWTIGAEDVDNAAAWAAGHQPKDAYLSRTSAAVNWSLPPTTVWVAGTFYASPDISTVIQEIVSRAGWASGNALNIMVWFLSLIGTDRTRVIRMWDYAGNLSGMKLDVTWTPPASKIPVFMCQYRLRRTD